MSVSNLAEGSLHGSWVELDYSQHSGPRVLEHVPSSSSIHNGDMEKILLDAQHESEKNSSRGSSHCDSPPLLMSPQMPHVPVEFETGSIADSNSTQSDEENQERSGEIEKLLRNNAEWIWYWSSRPENVPPKEFVFKHPKYCSSLSVRKTGVMKKGGIFSSEFVVFLIPSLLITHLFMLGVGIYIGKRLAASPASTL
ncbi:BCL2/adenovirus E1B 19 kDa protein-interacting protein 3-like [Carcharodon carcharias]|uniref:BCL2/adenovirus E1B 19 kDa protein-interacting protein 3-like n=1 Tax=Carcharodon carcharias TaxID=13397 RepID=UPI001B7E5CE1|nr:BCL2/adenovirus E1B 19 kDa protein-interacting protein 3-like [Carcharodon carcharias]